MIEEVPYKYARDKAIALAEMEQLDKITEVTYTYMQGGIEITQPLDYYNDIL